MEYLSVLLRTSTYRMHFRREATGLGTGTAGFLRLYDDKLLETIVFLPPEQEQSLILNSMTIHTIKVGRLVNQLQQQIELLDEYRTRLIADVVTGKLDVRDAAAIIPEADPLAEEDADDTIDAEMDSKFEKPDTAREVTL